MLLAVLVGLAFLAMGPVRPWDNWRDARDRMVREQIEARGVKDPRVLEAMRAVPRHEFVPPVAEPQAYEDHPLPIGKGQTISQPYIVALMTELLAPQKEDRVLEVGTGSGYQAAVLSGLVKQVYTIELIEELAASARQRLRRLGYKNVEVRRGDGYAGWPEQAPFDKIIVTAAPESVPPALEAQLKPGGRLVIPAGPRFGQELLVVEKDLRGRMKSRSVIPVMFVPMVKPGNGNGAADHPPDLQPAARTARQEVERAQTRLARMREAFEAGAVARKDVEEAERAVREAQDRFERLSAGTDPLPPALAAGERRRVEERWKTQRESLEKLRGLQEAGVAARREVEQAQEAVRETERFLELARLQEEELAHEQELARRVQEWEARGGRFDERVLETLESAYLARFGQPLPISALGMTQLHAVLKFDHFGRVDVPLPPDSPEGRWLTEQLAARDIPFMVYRSAVAGKATGAHIHLGLPSPRLK